MLTYLIPIIYSIMGSLKIISIENLCTKFTYEMNNNFKNKCNSNKINMLTITFLENNVIQPKILKNIKSIIFILNNIPIYFL